MCVGPCSPRWWTWSARKRCWSPSCSQVSGGAWAGTRRGCQPGHWSPQLSGTPATMLPPTACPWDLWWRCLEKMQNKKQINTFWEHLLLVRKVVWQGLSMPSLSGLAVLCVPMGVLQSSCRDTLSIYCLLGHSSSLALTLLCHLHIPRATARTSMGDIQVATHLLPVRLFCTNAPGKKLFSSWWFFVGFFLPAFLEGRKLPSQKEPGDLVLPAKPLF